MIKFSKRKLKNGLTVIHHYDETTPFVVVNILYNVGAKDETKTKTGFAHLFEHLMFGGTKQVKNFDHPLQEAGGENNAFTNNDYTNYYNVVPKENIATALYLEADRMVNLNINKKSLAVQRKVVCEEFKENYLNQPYGNAWHILRAMCYKKHPYQWPTIGKELSHIENATLEDVQQFYNKYYQPNNAFLVIAGNISSKQAFSYATYYFGAIRGKKINKKQIIEPQQTKAKVVRIAETVPLNALYIAFKMPEKTHKDFYTADIITDILSTGTSSRLYHKLVKEAKAFVEIDAYISASNEIGLFVIEGRIAEQYDVKQAEQLVWHEIERLQQELISEKEMQKIKNKMLTYMQFSDESLLNRAIGLAYFELLGNANHINKEVEKYQKVNARSIQQFSKKYLKHQLSNTLFYLKK